MFFTTLLAPSLLLATLTSAQSINVTIDDADGSIIYSNNLPATWNDETCAGCSAKPPNLQAVFDQTWKDGTRNVGDPPLTASLTFDGTGIYVFGITINSTSARPIIKNQNLSFTIDSQPAGSFVHVPNTPAYSYNVPFFGVGGLTTGEHTIEMTVEESSFVLLDYFIVTSTSTSATSVPSATTASTTAVPAPSFPAAINPTSPSGKSATPAIAGGVVGGIVLAGILVALLYWRILNKKRKSKPNNTDLLSEYTPEVTYAPDRPFSTSTLASSPVTPMLNSLSASYSAGNRDSNLLFEHNPRSRVNSKLFQNDPHTMYTPSYRDSFSTVNPNNTPSSPPSTSSYGSESQSLRYQIAELERQRAGQQKESAGLQDQIAVLRAQMDALIRRQDEIQVAEQPPPTYTKS